MEFKKEDWLIPSMVRTPDIEVDIDKYLGNEILENWRKSKDKDITNSIVFITERLDFICHLNAFRNYAINNSERKILIDGEGVVQLKYKFFMDNHDYSGVQYDIEALVLYLILSCIDAIQSQPDYLSAFEWLSGKTSRYENQPKDKIKGLLMEDKAQYDDLYGLSKNFRKAFTDDISDKLKKQIIENLIVAKFEGESVNKNSFLAWNSNDENAKIKKVANYLYNLRSKYTHKNIRNFIPKRPFGVRLLEGEYLLCKNGFDLDTCLIEILKELCLKKLVG